MRINVQLFRNENGLIVHDINPRIANGIIYSLNASISLSFGLIKKGVMLAAQPPYDPGYEGKTVALSHNLSDEEVEIEKGDHILIIVFSELTMSVEQENLYHGSYQGLNSLSEYCKQVKKGAVFALKRDLEKKQKKFESFMPNLLIYLKYVNFSPRVFLLFQARN